jgi:drug/metabolite transporter (DMT)-like permease
MGRIGGAQMALFGPLETLLSVIWSIIFLNEQLAPLQLVGGALILVSALLAVKRLGA